MIQVAPVLGLHASLRDVPLLTSGCDGTRLCAPTNPLHTLPPSARVLHPRLHGRSYAPCPRLAPWSHIRDLR